MHEKTIHDVKNVRIRSFSGPYFLAFGRIRETPNTDTFQAVIGFKKNPQVFLYYR